MKSGFYVENEQFPRSTAHLESFNWAQGSLQQCTDNDEIGVAWSLIARPFVALMRSALAVTSE